MKLPKKLILRALLVSSVLFTSSAAQVNNNIHYDEIANDFENSFVTPELKAKDKNAVREFMHARAVELYKDKMEVETARDGEVIIVTIPTDKLFAPNETSLRKDAGQILDKFKKFITPSGQYKLLLVMHSDDTGSPLYTFDLTDERVIAVLEYFERFDPADDSIKGYPRGDVEPLVPNNSRANRSRNRRLEIFIIPETGLVNHLNATRRK